MDELHTSMLWLLIDLECSLVGRMLDVISQMNIQDELHEKLLSGLSI